MNHTRPSQGGAPRIVAWEIINHGLDYSQYFQGCGVSHTEYEDVATGIGTDAREAYDDAVEHLAASWDVSRLPTRPRGISKRERVPAAALKNEASEAHIFVSIRVRGPKHPR